MDSNMNISTETAEWNELFSAGNKTKAVGLAGAVALHATNIYLVTTIMPSIVKDIGGLAYYAWNTTVFVVASIIGSVISSFILVQYAPRKAYRLAIILFSVGTLMCTLAPAMFVMLLGRFVQGFGGGLLFALSYAMVRIVFEQSLWPRAIALVSGMWGVAAFSGPFIGGIFAQYGHWRMAFGSLLVVCVLLLVITETTLPAKNETTKKTAIAYNKLVLLTLAVLAVSVGSVIEGLTANLAGIAVAIALLVMLVLMEKKKNTSRLLPNGAYSLKTMLGATYTVMALFTIGTNVEIFVPYFTQVIQGFSPFKAGYLMVLISLGWTFASIGFSGLSSTMVNRLLGTGAWLMLAGLAALSYFAPQPASAGGISFLLMCVSLVLVGAGIGMGWPHLLTRVFSSAQSGEEEMASASISTVQLMATAFGAALAGLVANLAGITHPGGVTGAQHAATWLYGSFAIAPLLVAILVLKKSFRKV